MFPKAIVAILATVLLLPSPWQAGHAAMFATFTDDFEQPDGPAVQWTVAQGTASVESGEYSLRSPPSPPPWDIGEVWTYAGVPPITFEGDLTVKFDMTFPERPGTTEGRHGGVMLYAAAPLRRQLTNGYTVWWIDRPWDRGYGIYRWDDNGSSAVLLGTFGEASADPGHTWVVRVHGCTISLTVDGVLKGSVVDATYRSGYVGLWTYANGQHARFDDMTVRPANCPLFMPMVRR